MPSMSICCCCNGKWICETALGTAWNAGIHAAFGAGLAWSSAIIQGLSVSSPIASMSALGSALIGTGTGLIRSGGFGHHFAFSGLSENFFEAHLSGETHLTLLTTLLGTPFGKKILGLEVSANDAWSSSGWPALVIYLIIHSGLAIKIANDQGWLSKCPSLPKLPSWCQSPPSLSKYCPSFPSFPFWNRSNTSTPSYEPKMNDLEKEEKSRELNEKYNEIIHGKKPLGHHKH